MNLRAAIVLVCAICAAPAGAQESPAEVTDAQIREYKTTNERGCLEMGKAQGDPPQKVAEFCKCITDVFEKSLTREDWQRAYFLSRQNRAAEERNVFGPHELKLRTCRPG